MDFFVAKDGELSQPLGLVGLRGLARAGCLYLSAHVPNITLTFLRYLRDCPRAHQSHIRWISFLSLPFPLNPVRLRLHLLTLGTSTPSDTHYLSNTPLQSLTYTFVPPNPIAMPSHRHPAFSSMLQRPARSSRRYRDSRIPPGVGNLGKMGS